MRILKLRFYNLNSLTGKWEIDFTHHAFTSDGIFAITGPTGAGKTTILDAICLALYGHTPRLGRISAGSNEIMSRHTGECYAEVEFAVAAKRYQCSWYQHRSRKKAQGKLQSPKRELSLLDSGEILTSSSREVDSRIEELTGMDMDRFTRSMLLAQGGFAAFLRASQDERAPILEQITGSAIYTQISQKVHERRSEEKRKDDMLQEQVSSLDLLSTVEEEELGQELREHQGREKELEKEIQQKNAILSLIDSIAGLSNELLQIQKEQAGLAKEEKLFAEDKQRLALALEALTLEGDHAALATTRKQQQTEEDELEQFCRKLPEIEKAVSNGLEELEAAQKKVQEGKKNKESVDGIIKQVRALDLRISEQIRNVRAGTKNCAQLREKIKKDQRKKAKISQEIIKTTEALEKTNSYLASHKADEGLVSSLTGIRELLNRLGETDEQLAVARESLLKAEKKNGDYQQAWKDKTEACSKAEKKLQAMRQQRQKLEKDIAATLAGQSIEELQEHLSGTAEQHNLIEKLLVTIKQRGVLIVEIKGLEARQAGLAQEIQDASREITSLLKHKEQQEQQIIALGTQVQLAGRIRDLEDERKRLCTNNPCPLCGSLEHPFAEEDGIPPLDGLEQELQTAVQAGEKIAGDLSDARVKAGRHDQEVTGLGNTLKEKGRALQQAEQEQQNWLEQLSDNVTEDVGETALKELLAELVHQQKKQRNQLMRLSQQDRQKAEINRGIELQQEAAAQAGKEQEQAANARENGELEHKRFGFECKQLEQTLAKRLALVKDELVGYGVSDVPLAGLDVLLEKLTERQQQWKSKQKAAIDIEESIRSLCSKSKEVAAFITSKTSQMEEAEQEMKAVDQQQQDLQQERGSLFGDRDADREEKKQKDAVQEAEDGAEKKKNQYNRLDGEKNQLIAAMADRTKSIAGREGELKSLEEKFTNRLKLAEFSGEDGWSAACLDEKERSRLSRRHVELRTGKTRIVERLQDRRKRVIGEEKELKEQQNKQQLDKISRADLAAEQEQLATSRNKTVELIGSIRERLLESQKKRDRQKELLLKVTAQQKECSRWDMLHSLIGSADGKKYRNFAQGLTFELMVGHANRQLAAMTDRYLLVRDTEQPLELNVIDSWQAGEVRSTKNLSGGESFVVSLALALGLSSMVGGTVRVDSLFLDEGFGALDEDALETALETLAGLRGEGKLIGVISHVGALKERISCRIAVVPGTGGQSVIRGPGVG